MRLTAAGLVLVEEEARGLEDRAVAEAAEAFDAALVGHPGGGGAAVRDRAQAVGLRVLERVAEPREVVGEAAWARGRAPGCQGSSACRRSGTPRGRTSATDSAPSQLGLT